MNRKIKSTKCCIFCKHSVLRRFNVWCNKKCEFCNDITAKCKDFENMEINK